MRPDLGVDQGERIRNPRRLRFVSCRRWDAHARDHANLFWEKRYIEKRLQYSRGVGGWRWVFLCSNLTVGGALSSSVEKECYSGVRAERRLCERKVFVTSSLFGSVVSKLKLCLGDLTLRELTILNNVKLRLFFVVSLSVSFLISTSLCAAYQISM